MYTKANQSLRNEMKTKGVTFWQLADSIGVTETTLVKRFRHELPPEKQKDMRERIQKIAAAKLA